MTPPAVSPDSLAALPEPSRRALLSRLSIGHFAADSYAGFMLPLLPMLSHSLGFGLGTTGLLLTFSSLSSSILQPAIGWLSDRYKNFNYALVGVVMAAVFISLIGISTSFEQLVVFILLGYLGIGMFHPQGTTLADRLAKGDRNAVMGVFISIGTLGFAAGPVISSALVSRLGLSGTVWAMVLGLSAAPLLLSIHHVVNRHLAARAKPECSKPETGLATPILEPVTRSFSTLSPGEKGLLAKLSIIGICRAILLVGMPTYLPFFWTQKGYPVETVGAVIGMSSFVGVPFGLWAGNMGDKVGEKVLMIVSFVPAMVLVPLMFLLEDVWAFASFILLIGCLEATLATSIVIGLKGVKSHPNTVSAIVGGFSWGIAGLFMPLLGWLGEQFGLQSALMSLMLPAVLAGLLSCRLPGKDHAALSVSTAAVSV